MTVRLIIRKIQCVCLRGINIKHLAVATHFSVALGDEGELSKCSHVNDFITPDTNSGTVKLIKSGNVTTASLTCRFYTAPVWSRRS